MIKGDVGDVDVFYGLPCVVEAANTDVFLDRTSVLHFSSDVFSSGKSVQCRVERSEFEGVEFIDGCIFRNDEFSGISTISNDNRKWHFTLLEFISQGN